MKNLFLWFKKGMSRLGRWFWVILAVVLITAVVLVVKRNGRAKVESFTVQRGPVSQELVLTGSVNAEKYSQLTFPTSGKISWIGVTEGQKVYRGQALISLDKTVLNTTYQEALNTYRKYQATAENVLDQVKDHSKDESLSQKDTRTTAEVNRDNAWDAVRAAKYNLDNATIFAPFAGIISSLPYSSPGVNVLSTAVQVEIVDPTTIYFDVEADQSEVISLKIGQDVAIILDSYKDKEFKATVSFISFTPKAGEAGAVYKVKVVFAQGVLGDILPRIGMTGDAKFILSRKDDVLYAPPKFINSDKDGKYVNLGKMGNKVRVEVGIEGESATEIISGVKAGDVLYD